MNNAQFDFADNVYLKLMWNYQFIDIPQLKFVQRELEQLERRLLKCKTYFFSVPCETLYFCFD